MSFLKSGKNKRKSRMIMRFGIAACCIVIFIIGCKQVNDSNLSKWGKEKKPNVVKESSVKENIDEEWTQEELDAMLVAIQKRYIFDKWYHDYDEENMYYLGNDYSKDRTPIKSEDLEEVIFYQDNENTIYFIPTSAANKIVSVDGEEIQVCEYHNEKRTDYYLYHCTFGKARWEREIYPEPNSEYVDIFCSMKMREKLKELHFIGTSRLAFPENITDEVIRHNLHELYENEYTDAVVEIIHSYFQSREKYGEYQIYFGSYSYDQLEYEQHGYKITITVAIVGEETSYWWVFRAKDILDEDGRVIVESNGGANHSDPGSYEAYSGVYAEGIDNIIRANRLVVPLTVTESDEVRELGIFKDEDDLNTIHYYLK